MSGGGFPMLFIRLGEGAPSEPGVYVRVTDVAAWLRDVGEDDLAELMDEVEHAPITETRMVVSP